MELAEAEVALKPELIGLFSLSNWDVFFENRLLVPEEGVFEPYALEG
jgi:hypothetical protein